MDTGHRTLFGLRLLVVEDDDDTREVLALGLSLYGADVVAVSSAAEALVALEKRIPDVILSDIGLPDEDGFELIRRVRAMPPSRGGRVPAVAVTAYTLGDGAEEVTRRAGFQRHFRKPVDTKALFGAVAALARSGRVERRRVVRRRHAPRADRPRSLEKRTDTERRTMG